MRIPVILAMTFLLATLCFFSGTKAAEVNEPIYIRADGSVDPMTAPIQQSGNTYSLKESIKCYSNGIVVERDDIVLDGWNFVLKGNGSEAGGTGIDLTGRTNVTVTNFQIGAFYQGILLNNSLNINISGNDLTSWNMYALRIISSPNNSISGNTINCFVWRGVEVLESPGMSFSRNEVGNPDNISRNYAFWLENSSYCRIMSNNITDNDYGIRVINCLGNTISGNTIANNQYNLKMESSGDNMVEGNRIAALRYSATGILLTDCTNNTIFGNDICFNYAGVYLYKSPNNTFYHNNFENNAISQVTIVDSACTWDVGYPSSGNYWNDYSGVDLYTGPCQNETGSDGIGDWPYVINENNRDNYPLLGPFQSFNVSWIDSGYAVDLISNSTVSAFEVGTWIDHPEERIVKFNVTSETGSAGFCRICIPTALLNATYTVLLNGTEIPFTLLPCSNSTHSYLYFNYTHSTGEVIIIPESPSFVILPLFMIATLMAVKAHKRKHIT